nr:MAG TPA: portal [Caudoviricetes sp.]
MSADIKNSAVADMHAQTKPIRALMGGTAAMRKESKNYLPKWPQEEDKAYQIRLSTSTLLPVLRETVGQMVGRVFFRDIDTERVAPELLPLLGNIDLKNNALPVFCAAWFADALAYGAAYAVVDYPQTDGGNRTLADDKARGLRPYCVLVRNEDVLGFRSEERGGVEVCTQFRYRQLINVSDGEFGDKTVEQINVLEPGRIRRYLKGNDSWELDSESVMTAGGALLDFVPVVEFTPEKSGFFAGRPPLLELAYLNIKHWQSQSDQDNITHYVRVPLLAYSGGEDIQAVTAAAGNMIALGSEGSLQYVEHSGAAIQAGVAALEKLESDMQAAGAKLLTRTKLALTDSQARDEQGREVSLLRHYANLFEDSVARVLGIMARWSGIKDGGTVEISGNIDADYNPAASLDVLLKMNTAGVLSNQTLFEEAKRRGLVSNMAEWEDEQARLQAQAESSVPPAMDFGQPEK